MARQGDVHRQPGNHFPEVIYFERPRDPTPSGRERWVVMRLAADLGRWRTKPTLRDTIGIYFVRETVEWVTDAGPPMWDPAPPVTDPADAFECYGNVDVADEGPGVAWQRTLPSDGRTISPHPPFEAQILFQETLWPALKELVLAPPISDGRPPHSLGALSDAPGIPVPGPLLEQDSRGLAREGDVFVQRPSSGRSDGLYCFRLVERVRPYGTRDQQALMLSACVWTRDPGPVDWDGTPRAPAHVTPRGRLALRRTLMYRGEDGERRDGVGVPDEAPRQWYYLDLPGPDVPRVDVEGRWNPSVPALADWEPGGALPFDAAMLWQTVLAPHVAHALGAPVSAVARPLAQHSWPPAAGDVFLEDDYPGNRRGFRNVYVVERVVEGAPHTNGRGVEASVLRVSWRLDRAPPLACVVQRARVVSFSADGSRPRWQPTNFDRETDSGWRGWAVARVEPSGRYQWDTVSGGVAPPFEVALSFEAHALPHVLASLSALNDPRARVTAAGRVRRGPSTLAVAAAGALWWLSRSV